MWKCLFLLALLGAIEARHFPYIIGGQNVNPPGKWPFMVSLWSSGVFGQHFCGGTLISSNWIVTASHCVAGQSSSGVLALTGAHNFDDSSVGDPEFYTVRRIIMHESYNQFTLDNDIALIQLDDNVVMNGYTDTIDMADSADGNFAGDTCVIIGWGGDTFPGGSSYPSILQEAYVPALTNLDCQQNYNDRNINSGHICVGIRNEAGGCYGDSGGPLVCPDSRGSYVLAGATSFGPPYCPPIQPTVYTRISYFREWIRNYTGI